MQVKERTSYSFPSAEDFHKDFDSNTEFIGGGSFGKVYKATSKRSINGMSSGCQDYAIKFVENLQEETYTKALIELQLNCLINIHPNVIHIEKVYAWAEQVPIRRYLLVFAMKLMDGNLKSEFDHRITQNERFTVKDEQVLDIMTQCILTFEYLIREKHLCHRDIKPQNLLYQKKNDKYSIYISDFGVSKALQLEKLAVVFSNTSTVVGTRDYLAPKLYEAYVHKNLRNIQQILFFSLYHRHNLEKSDIFSFGLTMLQMILLLTDNQISGMNDPQTDGDQNIKPAQNKILQQLNKIQNKLIKKCIEGMLEFDEQRRITWKEAAQIICPQQILEINPEIYNSPRPQKKITFNIPVGSMKHFSNEKTQLKLNQLGFLKESSKSDQKHQIKGIVGMKMNIAIYNENGILLYDSEGIVKELTKLSNNKQREIFNRCNKLNIYKRS